MSTRIIFNPYKGYTTSIHNYFLKNQTDKFFTVDKRETFSLDSYFKGWDGSKVFVDCHSHMINRIRENKVVPQKDFPVNCFDNDYLIYNIRPYEKQLRSLFLTRYFDYVSGKYGEINLEDVFVYAVYSYSIRLLQEAPKVHGFTGDVHFFQDKDYDLNIVLDICNIEHENIVLPNMHRESAKQRHVKKYLASNKAYIEFYHKYKGLIEEIKIENVELLKNNLSYGDFDAEHYLYTHWRD